MSQTIELKPRVQAVTLEPRHVASIRMATDRRRLYRTIGIIHELVMDVVGSQGLAPAGPLFARFHHLGPQVDVEAGLLLAQPIEAFDAVGPSMLPGGDVLHTLHVGDHDSLDRARTALAAYGATNGFRPAGAPWECYLVDARDSSDAGEWLTDIYLPVRARRAPETRPD